MEQATMTSMQRNMTARELEAEALHVANRNAGYVPLEMADQMARNAVQQASGDQQRWIELADELACNLEERAREAVKIFCETHCEQRYADPTGQYSILVPDQLAYYEEQCREWLVREVDQFITPYEAERITTAIASGRIPYEIAAYDRRLADEAILTLPGAEPAPVCLASADDTALSPSSDASLDVYDMVLDAKEARVSIEQAKGNNSEAEQKALTACARAIGLDPSRIPPTVYVEGPEAFSVLPNQLAIHTFIAKMREEA